MFFNKVEHGIIRQVWCLHIFFYKSRSDISAGTGMRHEDLQSVRTGSGKILLQHIHNIGTALYPSFEPEIKSNSDNKTLKAHF